MDTEYNPTPSWKGIEFVWDLSKIGDRDKGK